MWNGWSGLIGTLAIGLGHINWHWRWLFLVSSFFEEMNEPGMDMFGGAK